MVALLFPRPELLSVLLYGSAYDPTYRPFPGGRYDIESDLFEDDEQQEPEAGASYSVQPVVAEALPMRADLMAGHWRRHTTAMAVIVAGSSATRLYGLVRLEAGPRLGNTGLRNGTITDRALFTSPVSLDEVVASLPSRHARTVRQAVSDEVSRPLPPGAGDAFLTALGERVDGIDAAASVLARQPRFRLLREGRTVFRFDTVTTTLRAFERDWRALAPATVPEDPPDEVAAIVRLYERDAITDDAGVLPGWERSRQTVAGWWEFRSGDRRLRVKNVDATHYERRSGADLIYMRRDPDTFVLVQYKMLSANDAGTWEYIEDDRLASQLARMQAISASSSVAGVPDLRTFRLGPGATFVKLVEPPRSPRDPDALLPGYYLPSEYMSLLLPQPAPPGGSRRLAAPPARYLDGEVFIRLVRDAWLGTVADATDRLRSYFLSTQGSPLTTDLTFAYEDRLPG